MREFKFRAWREKSNEFIYFNSFKMMGDLFSWRELVCREELEVWNQYTGLKDKNNKKIYEGDIVESDDTKGLFNIVYNAPSFALIPHHHQDLGLFYELYEDTLIVRGNIYENPELLETL